MLFSLNTEGHPYTRRLKKEENRSPSISRRTVLNSFRAEGLLIAAIHGFYIRIVTLILPDNGHFYTPILCSSDVCIIAGDWMILPVTTRCELGRIKFAGSATGFSESSEHDLHSNPSYPYIGYWKWEYYRYGRIRQLHTQGTLAAC